MLRDGRNRPVRVARTAIALVCLALLFAGQRTLRAAPESAVQPPRDIPPHPSRLVFPPSDFRLPARRLLEWRADVTAFLEPDHSLPLVEIVLALPVGSQDDPASKEGLAFLTGAMVRRGGGGERSPSEVDQELDSMGAELVTAVREGRSVVRLSAPTWALEDAVGIMLDVLIEPSFDQPSFDLIRRSSLESLEQRNDNPLDVLDREWSRLLHGAGHPAARAPTAKSLQAISRADLFTFHQCRWRPEDLVVALSGDISSAALGHIEERLLRWSQGPGPEGCPEAPPTPGPTDSKRAAIYLRADSTPQAKVMLGHRLSVVPNWSANDRFALLVTKEILGGAGAISRINGRLRAAEGLVYRSSADLTLELPGSEALSIFLETRSDQVWRASEIAIEEVERLRRQPVHPRELAVVRDTLIGSLRSNFDTAEEVAGHFAEGELLGRPEDYWRKYLAGISSVTREDVLRVAQEYFLPEQFSILVVGPEKSLLAAGAAELSRRFGGRPVHRLPERDPLTLEPMRQIQN